MPAPADLGPASTDPASAEPAGTGPRRRRRWRRGLAETAVTLLVAALLSVRPDWWRQGVGKALMHAVLGAADALGEPLVVLLGSTRYYPKFGFRLASEYEITPKHPEWTADFQVRTLTAYDPAVRGEFTYPEPFDRL